MGIAGPGRGHSHRQVHKHLPDKLLLRVESFTKPVKSAPPRVCTREVVYQFIAYRSAIATLYKQNLESRRGI